MAHQQSDSRRRKKLPHGIPAWVPDGSRYFITINCKQRGHDLLCAGGIAQRLIESISIYESLDKWCIYVFVVMPDHLHFIASMNLRIGIKPIIKSWKSFHAKQSGVEWQEDFFEHRLRDEAEFIEKSSYIRMNPVRRNLVTEWRDWPFMWTRGDWPIQ